MSRPLLAPLGWVYGVSAALRNAAFDSGILRVTDAGVPVVSVGNITAGGSGKTPLVEHIVRRLSAQGAVPCVISRGYGRGSRGVVVVSDGRSIRADARRGGDEPVQIAYSCPGVRVVVGERRVDAARVAAGELGAGVLVMDDGFQHRYLKRSLDIVVIDSRSDPFEDRLLPAGMLREGTAGLGRATLVALSRSETCDVPWREKLRRVFQGPLFAYVARGSRLSRFSAVPAAGPVERKGWPWEGTIGPLVAFSGIGDHSVFIAELKRLGITVAAERRFPDHHWYGAGDAAAIAELLKGHGAAGFVTTEKDSARLRAVPEVAAAIESAGPMYALAVEVRITDGGDALESALAGLGAKGTAGVSGSEAGQERV
jgi:tetraacyldisaccharide 4'-kinase